MKNSKTLIVSISNTEDLKKITKDTRYINIDITNPDYDIITYFLNKGRKYKYADIINNMKGYNYVDYEIFAKAEALISLIYANMPSDLTPLEMAKYLYVAIGQCVSFDINVDASKNELCNLSLVTSINNLWGALALGSVNDVTASKIYYYLCRRLGLDIALIANEKKKTAMTKLLINNQVLVTDLFEDIPFIKADMQTRHFATYNDDFGMDKKIKYITNKYMDYYLDRALKVIDYTAEDCVFQLLNKIKNIIDVSNIKPLELSVIYKHLFNTYCTNYNIKINNLFLNNNLKKHFLLISYNDNHYSYNYKQKAYVQIIDKDLIDSLNVGKIGLYLNETIPNLTINEHLN